MISALVFNPSVHINLLAASYLDGELVLLDPVNDCEIKSHRANCYTLAASPDGRLLAGGAGFGIVQVYEFDTLRLLYRVKASDSYIKQLVWSTDRLRFADIRESQCNVWEPPVLLRDLGGDDSSDNTWTYISEASVLDSTVNISAMVLYPPGELLIMWQGRRLNFLI